MPTLHFKGKTFVQNHHLAVKYHQLVPKKELSLTNKVSLHDNLIIQGDNLKALKALLPTYAGKVKCIYIDPPYNTGSEKWVYNDNVNSPMIQEWLGKVVDKEDMTKHDKWLCMMMPRLKLLRDLLSEDGILFVSIGDDEVGNLTVLLDEIFGLEKQVLKLTWKSRAKPTNAGNAKFRPQKVAEYVLGYTKSNPEQLLFNLVSGSERRYTNSDSEGNYRTTTILTSNLGMFQRETMRTELPNGYKPNDEQRWKVGEDEILNLYEKGRIVFNDGNPLLKVYENDEDELLYPLYTYVNEDLSSTAEAGKTELNKILGKSHGFDTVKPVNLLKYLLYISTKEGDIVLDSFAGSGTTAHAVLELNKEDGGNRKFILVEMEDYANTITAERVRRVINGVKTAKSELLKKGTGGSFSYFELGNTIEMESLLRGKNLPTYTEFARYLFYTATGEEFNEKAINDKIGFIGESKNYELYLFYKAELDWLKKNALTLELCKSLPKFKNKQRLVFAPAKYVDDHTLLDFRIDFCQLPYEIYRIQK
ncbi:MAG TPA: site-specific DNA-methyltransferase [Bacteroidetes bacterium]|nr:site-specific DNA-methyltransferase [Bacteroidota bacterium]